MTSEHSTDAMEQQPDNTTASSRSAPDTEPEPPSCDSCRKRKLRCSRDLPTCTNCVRSHSRCTYDYQRKRPGLKPGTLDALTRRVESLEAAQAEGLAQDQPAASNEAQTSTVIKLLVDELKLLNSNITTSLRRDNRDEINTSGAAAASNSRKRPRSEAEMPNGGESVTHDQSDRDHDQAQVPMFLSEDFVERLLAAYFKNVHPWIPMLHEDIDRSRLRQISAHDDGSILLHAVFLAAHHFVQDITPWERSDLQSYAAKSRELIVQLGMSTLALDNLRALTIVAYIDIAEGETSKAWSIIGSLTRTVSYLQLSVEEEALETTQRTTLLSDLPELPSATSWVERESRRRLFWNVFLLDRFCAIATGWKASLTGGDVARRLPADGGLWRRCQAVTTPYFGIWDHNAANIDRTIAFLPSKYGSPAEANVDNLPEASTHHSDRSHKPAVPVRAGAFAYCIESVESLSRMNSFFLQQKIDLTDREEVSSWLTRFKELDLRLVHWKRFLPQRWKNPSDTPNPTTSASMDPNMTLAHIVHNTASIFLHQKIAYSSPELGHLRLPSACSADTCCNAAIETSTIAAKYLQQDVVTRAIAPLFSLCLFISAKILLVQSSYHKAPLASEFWTLIKCLETISQNWKGHHHISDSPASTKTLAGDLAMQLRRLYEQSGPASPAIELFKAHTPVYDGAQNGSTGVSPSLPTYTEQRQKPLVQNGMLGNGPSSEAQQDGQPQVNPGFATTAIPMDSLSAGLLDQNFLLRDRIINYDDFTFNTEMYGFPDMM